MQYYLNKDVNSFFYKGDIVELISDWGSLLYVSKGILRVAVDRCDVVAVKEPIEKLKDN